MYVLRVYFYLRWSQILVLGMVVPEGETPVPESYWKTLSTCRGSVLGGSCYCIKAKHHVSGFQILQG